MSDAYTKMSHEARELALFIENDAQLHRSQEVPIQKNLINKMAAGTYDKTLAVKLWGYLVESGAKKYTQEHCGRDCVWSRQFPPGVRKEVAELFAKSFEVEAKLGNYDSLLMHQKAGSAKRKGGGGADYAMAKPYYAAGGGGARAKKTTWTYEGYWNVVLGEHRSADGVVWEFDLVPGRRGLDEWLGTAEAEAWRQGGLKGDIHDAWGDHHVRALDALEQATETISRPEGGGGARAKKIKSLTVIERVWRDKTYGNNYASVEILIDGKHAAKLPAAYGSGSMSEGRVVDWLVEHGYVKAPRNSHGGRQPLHRVASDNGFTKNVESFHVLKREM